MMREAGDRGKVGRMEKEPLGQEGGLSYRLLAMNAWQVPKHAHWGP